MLISKNAYNAAGFTLLEVMISISIIALIIVSLFRMQSGSISLATANKFNQCAPVLANNLLVRIGSDIEGFTEREGDFGKEFPGISWTCDISDAGAEFGKLDFFSSDSIKLLKRIEVRIQDRSGREPFSITCWRIADE